ncbi:MAG: hypothetical protein LBV43_07365 [Prevotella sp.]|jgi:hypothetical protein|nr:hypothetical protein [Prevotella sp.]
MEYEILFLKSLTLTIFIETIVLIVFVRYILKQNEIKIPYLIITGLIASFATLPYLWFILPYFIQERIVYIIIGESFAVLVETFIIGAVLRIGFTKSLLCSFVCNLISFSIGLLISW